MQDQQDRDQEPYDAPPLPFVVERPKGWRFYAGTWTGRIIVLNTLVFVFLCIKTQSILLPDTEALLALGAKDPVSLAHGEIWRFITPVFIHIGIIHFLVNNYMLYMIGYQIERIVGGAYFLTLYLLTGFAGNVASSVFSTNLSAGASSALFGILGCGFFLERTVGNKIKAQTGRTVKNRAYAMTVVINLAFGFIVPFVDNSAHLGGLVMGVLLTFAMVNLRKNSLQPVRRGPGIIALVLAVVASGVGVYFGTSAHRIKARLVAAGDAATEPEESFFHYSQALAIDDSDGYAHLKRARLYLMNGETRAGLQDLRIALEDPTLAAEVEKLAAELDAKGRKADAWEVRRMAAHGGAG